MNDIVITNTITISNSNFIIDSIGDVLINTAGTLYDELHSVLLSLGSLTPELRYTKLKTYFSICKKKLVQLLSISKWLTIPGKVEYFQNINSLRDQLTQIENLLNEAEYTLYCTHSHLFSRRVRSLNVTAAKDILAKGTYPYIPIEVFTCGVEPSIKYSNDEKAAMNKRLAICIRAKLALYDKIPTEITCSNIIDGLLILKRPYLYEVGITLSYASEKAPWKVIGFRILSDIHKNENVKIPKNLYDKETYEHEVMKILCKSNNNIQKNDESSMNTNDKPNNNNDNDYKNLVSIHKICIHASLAICLRLFYVLANNHAKTIKRDLLVDFHENNDASSLKISFWKNSTTGNLLYELRIIHARIQSSSSSSRSGTIIGNRFFLELYSRHQDKEKLDCKQIKGLQETLNAEDFVTNGSTLSGLLTHVFSIIAESKLKLLLARLLITPEVITAMGLGLKVELNNEKLGIVLSFGSFSSELVIGVDNQYGKFITIYNGNSSHANIDIFLNEINNIETENYIIRVQEESGINADAANQQLLLKPFITAELILFQLAVGHWTHLFRCVGELELAPINGNFLLESNGIKFSGETLIFELSSCRSQAALNNYIISNAMMSIPQAYMLPDKMLTKRAVEEMDPCNTPLLKKLKPNEMLLNGPDIFVYLVLIIDKSYSATTSALLCSRNKNHLFLPTVTSSIAFDALQFYSENSGSEIRHVINSAYEWKSSITNKDASVRPYTIALSSLNDNDNDTSNDLYYMSYFSEVSVTVLAIRKGDADIDVVFLLLQEAESRVKDGLTSITPSVFEELMNKSEVLMKAKVTLRRSSSSLSPVIESITSNFDKKYDAVCHQHLHVYISHIQADGNNIFSAIIDSLHRGRLLLEFYGVLAATSARSKYNINLIHYDNVCDIDEISMLFSLILKDNKEIIKFLKVEARMPNSLIVDVNGNLVNVKISDMKNNLIDLLN